MLRLPAVEMGREAAFLAAGVVYNVLETAFRWASLGGPIPYYFVIDEVQDIGAGMRLEALLSGGRAAGAADCGKPG